MSRRRNLITAFLFLLMASVLPGTTSRELAEQHPAARSVVEYLRLLLAKDFAKAAALVDPDSLRKLKEDYQRRLKSPRLPLDEVMAMIRAVGVSDEAELEKMTPPQFFIGYNQGLQRRYNVTDEVNQRIADTLELDLLAVGEEGPDLAHFLVRTHHQTMRNEIKNLEIVSMARRGERWLVSLGENLTKVRPLEEPSPAPATPAASPAGSGAPARQAPPGSGSSDTPAPAGQKPATRPPASPPPAPQRR